MFLASDVEPGSRLHVYSADMKEDLGLGTFQYEATIHTLLVLTADKGPVMYTNESDPEVELPVPPGLSPTKYRRKTINTPKILLDSGRVIYGFQCWWKPAKENKP